MRSEAFGSQFLSKNTIMTLVVGHSAGYVKASPIWNADYAVCSVLDTFYPNTKYNFWRHEK